MFDAKAKHLAFAILKGEIMSKKNYALATGGGVFYDDETGLKVLPGSPVSIDKSEIGAKTNQAILSGGLVEVTEEKKSSSKSGEKTESDLPEDFPGRDELIKAKMTFDQVKTFDFEKEKVEGVGKATVEKIQAYLKK